MATKAPVQSILPIEEFIKQAKDKWYDKHDSAEITNTVNKILDARVEQALAQILGFRKDQWRCNVWEVDNCNGRAGNNALGAGIEAIVADIVRRWAVAHADEMDKLFNTVCEAAFKKHVRERLSYKANTVFSAYADNALEKYAKEHMDEALQDVLKDIGLPLMDK